jgi:aminoglycoside/choline kinase family phosphotransferase
MLNQQDTVFQWLIDFHQFSIIDVQPLLGDASFRKYYRLLGYFESQKPQTFILMEAPKTMEKTEDFIKIDHFFHTHHIRVPQILKMNDSQELLLLEDFGDRLLLNELHHNNLSVYYKNALDIIAAIQNISVLPSKLPPFDIDHMIEEMAMFKDWFLNQHLNIHLTLEDEKMIEDTFLKISQSISLHPQTIIHRDFHARNLMILDNDALGVIDFQDAMIGPRSYDVVSLLKDCYIVWDEPIQKQWCEYFHDISNASCDFQTFWKEFNLCGLQRHLKVLGIFCRLYHRDGKDRYLNDLPVVWNYTLTALQKMPEYETFFQFMKKIEPVFHHD